MSYKEMRCVAFTWVVFVFGSFVGYAQNPNPVIGAPVGQCTVTGRVWKSGPQPINAGETLTQAILRAGGMVWGETKVRLTRRNKDGQLETLTFSVKAIIENRSNDPVLRDGDRIFVP